jgi:ABC-type nitrate/sulfonate/bicarbonate transport system substrate-binding protein
MKNVLIFILAAMLVSCNVLPGAGSSTRAASTPTPNKLTPVNICYSAVTGSQSSAWYAYEKGYFRKNGLDVHLIGMSTGGATSNVITSLVAGENDFCLASGSVTMNGAASGLDVTTLAAVYNVYTYVLMVSPSVQTAANLKGKILGVANSGSPATSAMRIILKNLGLDPDKDVTLLAVGEEAARISALQSGRVDGTTLIAPNTYVARKAGFRAMVDMGELKIPYLHTNLVTTRTYMASHRSTALSVLRSFCEAIAAMKSDAPGTKEVIAKYSNLDVQKDADMLDEIYASFIQRNLEKIPYPNLDGIKNLQSELATTNPAVLNMKPDDILDMSLLKELEKDGLFTRLYP